MNSSNYKKKFKGYIQKCYHVICQEFSLILMEQIIDVNKLRKSNTIWGIRVEWFC